MPLDPLTRASLQRQFVDLTRRLGKTAIFVTHDLREALRLGSRIGLAHRGTVGAAGNARESFSNPRKNMRALIWKRSSYRWKTSPMEEARELLAISPTKLNELLTHVGNHLTLVLVSTLIAVVIGIPTGILLTRKKALRSPILGIANVMQTIPAWRSSVFSFYLSSAVSVRARRSWRSLFTLCCRSFAIR